jgi:hypothetical protein
MRQINGHGNEGAQSIGVPMMPTSSEATAQLVNANGGGAGAF